MPKIICGDASEDWFIMDDFNAKTHMDFSINEVCKVIELYADMQIYSTKNVDKFKEAGCSSIDVYDINSYFKVIINYFMNWITEENLQVSLMQKWISQECDKLYNTSLVTLSLHNEDFREGNIVISGDNPVLFDWKNTVISHPFFSIDYFLRRCVCHTKAYDFKQELLKTYLEKWNMYGDVHEHYNTYRTIRRLFDAYDAVRCFCDLRYLDTSSQWYKNTYMHIMKCLRNINKIANYENK